MNVFVLCFRFGKHRKPTDLDFEMETEDPLDDMEVARRAAREEQQRIQEQYKRLVQRHRQMEEQVSSKTSFLKEQVSSLALPS